MLDSLAGVGEKRGVAVAARKNLQRKKTTYYKNIIVKMGEGKAFIKEGKPKEGRKNQANRRCHKHQGRLKVGLYQTYASSHYWEPGECKVVPRKVVGSFLSPRSLGFFAGKDRRRAVLSPEKDLTLPEQNPCVSGSLTVLFPLQICGRKKTILGGHR